MLGTYVRQYISVAHLTCLRSQIGVLPSGVLAPLTSHWLIGALGTSQQWIKCFISPPRSITTLRIGTRRESKASRPCLTAQISTNHLGDGMCRVGSGLIPYFTWHPSSIKISALGTYQVRSGCRIFSMARLPLTNLLILGISPRPSSVWNLCSKARCASIKIFALGAA